MILGNVGFSSVGDVILGLLPIRGLYETGLGWFLAIIVGIELFRYIWFARPIGQGMRKIGYIPMYILTAMYFGWFVLLFVVVFHWLKLRVYIHNNPVGETQKVADEEPDPFPQAPSNFDLSLMFITSIFAVVLSNMLNLPAWLDRAAWALPGNLKWLGFIICMVLLVWCNSSFLETKDPRKESLGKLITLIILFFGFGTTGLILYMVYLVIAPWIHYKQPLHKLRNDPMQAIGSGVEHIANAPTWANQIVQQSKDFSTNLVSFLKTNLRIKSKVEREKQREESLRENSSRQNDLKLAAEIESENKKFWNLGDKRRKEGSQELVNVLEDEIEESEREEERSTRNLFLSELKLDEKLNNKIPHHHILTFFIIFLADILDFVGFASPANIFGWIIDGIAVFFLLKNVSKSPISQILLLPLLALEFYFLSMNINFMIYFVFVLLIEHFSNKDLITYRKKERKAGRGNTYVEWKPVIWSVAILLIVIVALPYSGVNFNKIIVESREMIRVTAQEGIRLQIRLAEENPIDAIISGWSNLWAQATNPYYGVVDGSQKRDLGGKFTRFKSDPIVIAPGENALVTASLKLELLDDDLCVKNPKDPFCRVQLFCEIDGRGYGEVTPRYLNVLDIKSGEIVTCEYTPTKEGLFIYNLQALYNFETLAYLPVYFADDVELTNARKNRDFKMETYISSKGFNANPVAVFSPGPFYVGISTSEGSLIRVKEGGLEPEIENPSTSPSVTTPSVDLTQISSGIPAISASAVVDITGSAIGDSYGSPLGISIGNHWTGGEIQKINKLGIIVDENLRLDECSVQMKEEKVENGERYYVNDKSPVTGKIEKFKTITCRLKNADLSNPKGVLRGRPIIQSDIKVQVVGVYASKLGIGVKAEGLPVEKKFKENEQGYLDICESNIDECSDYDDATSSMEYCNRNPCKSKINGCYWEAEFFEGVDALGLIDQCESCPSDATCSLYDSETTCAYDGCGLGCDWSTPRESCIPKNVDESVRSFTQDNRVYVDKCFGKKVQIKNEFKHDILAPHSGFIVYNDVLKRLTINTFIGGSEFISIFDNVENPWRKNGNVYPGQLIGVSDKFNYTLKRGNEEIDLFDFYKEQSSPIQLVKGENCEVEAIAAK